MKQDDPVSAGAARAIEHLNEDHADALVEMAQALGRTEDKLNYALLRLELAARAIDAAPDELVRYDRVKEFNALRQEALDARRNLQIHREAIGIRRNRMLDDLYPIPPRR